MNFPPPATYVLVYGARHGGWCRRFVADRLKAGGGRVFAPTLTGLGERAHLLDKTVNLSTHIEDICRLIRAEQLSDIVLVGHSYGGMVVSGVADRMPERLGALVIPGHEAMVDAPELLADVLETVT